MSSIFKREDFPKNQNSAIEVFLNGEYHTTLAISNIVPELIVSWMTQGKIPTFLPSVNTEAVSLTSLDCYSDGEYVFSNGFLGGS